MNDAGENKKRPERYWLYLLTGILIGIGLGWLYFYYVGCRTGACPLRSNPYYNMLLGALLGYIVTDWIVMAAFKRRKRDKQDL